MATAPDPKQATLELALKEEQAQLDAARDAREAMVMWIGFGPLHRTLRYQDTTAAQTRQLRAAAGVSVLGLWRDLTNPVETPLDVIVIGWWLAGLQQGADEDLDELLGRSWTDDPWVRWLNEGERAEVNTGGDDLDPLS